MLFHRPDTNDFHPDMVQAARGLPRAAKTRSRLTAVQGTTYMEQSTYLEQSTHVRRFMDAV